MSKRWMTTAWPAVITRTHPSKKKAYEYVIAMREAYEQGHRCNVVVVKVSEDKGPWQTYERLEFRRAS